MSRGKLTDEVQALAKIHFAREISVAELRLMPYVQYLLMNEQRLEPQKLNQEDREILARWRDEGHLLRPGGCYIEATREFWDIINDLMWTSYVESQYG